VLNTKLDLTSAMRVSFSSRGLIGVPIGAAAKLACGPSGPFANGVARAYGNSYLVDVGVRRAVLLTGRAQCELWGRSGAQLHPREPRFGVTACAPEFWRRERSSCSDPGLGRRRP